MADPNAEFLKQRYGQAPAAAAPDPNAAFLQSMFGSPATVPPGPKVAKDIGDAVFAGLQSSATGLAYRGKMPDVQLADDAPWTQRIASGFSGMLLDLPLSAVGAVPGMVAGGAAGSAVPGVGTAIGVAVGGGAGAFAAPMALREALIEAYSNNYATSWEQVWEISKAALLGGGKGAVIGGATMGAGTVAARTVGAAIAPGVGTAMTVKGATRTIEAAALGAELTALTTTAAGLDGRMPTWHEFMDNAILLGGMKGAVKIAGGLRNTFAETGKRPEEVMADAARDPTVVRDLQKAPQEVPEAYRQLAFEQRVEAALDADRRPAMMEALLQQAKDPEAKVLKEPVRYEYVTNQETAQAVVRAAADAYRAVTEVQRRGVVTDEAVLLEATRLVKEGAIERRAVNTADTVAEITARAMLTKGAAERAFKTFEQLADIPVEQRTPEMRLQIAAAFESVGMFRAELAGAGAEAGRALRILGQIKRNPDMLGDAETLLKAYEKKGDLFEIAQLARSLRDPEQLKRFQESYEKATTLEMVLEGWKASILSGFLTSGANVIGNTIRFGVEIPTAALTATVEAGRLAAKGTPMPAALYRAKAAAPMIGVQLGMRDALTVAAEVWRQKGEHLEAGDKYKSAIPGKTGELIRTPFRVLQVQDVFFRTFAERGKAYELAVERAGKEGYAAGTREFDAIVKQYVDQPQLGLSLKDAQGVTKQIEQAGAEAIFSQRLGPRMEQFSRSVQGGAFEFIFPFRRTPINLMSWSMQYTPGLNLLSGRWRDDFMAGGERRSQALTRVSMGVGLSMMAYSLAEQGLLTGGGLFDEEQNRTKSGAGRQPYSLKVGDNYYSIARLEPVNKPLMIAADIFEMQKVATDKNDKAKLGLMAVALFGNATISMNYMSGISNAMNAALEPNRYAESFVEQYASSLVPKIIGQTVSTIDPYSREVNGAMDAIQAQLPFIREKLLPRRDVWGEPVENKKLFSVLPIQMTEESKNKVKTEALRLQIGIADVPKFITEKGPLRPGERQMEIGSAERNLLREVSGKYAMEILAPVVNSPDWDGRDAMGRPYLPDYAKQEFYRDVIKDQRERAKAEILPADMPAREAVRQKMINKVIQQTDGTKAPEKRVKATQ